MQEEPVERGTKLQLAIALAQGGSIRGWARAHNVPRNTAQRWSKEPEVRKGVAACRRRMIDRAVGQMVKRAARSVKGTGALADTADSESVRLRAHRAMLSDMMTMSNFGVLDDRMTEIEERLDEPDKDAARPS
jgi:hypothetical protein